MSLYSRTQKLFREWKSDVVENTGQGPGNRMSKVLTLYISDELTISYAEGRTADYSFSWDNGPYIAITRRGVTDYNGVSKREAEELVAKTLTEYGV